MSDTASTTSTTVQSLLKAVDEFTRKVPASRVAVSVRGNRALIEKLRLAARSVPANDTMPKRHVSSDNLYGLKLIEDERVPDFVHYIKYADGHEELVTMFGTFVREADKS